MLEVTDKGANADAESEFQFVPELERDLIAVPQASVAAIVEPPAPASSMVTAPAAPVVSAVAPPAALAPPRVRTTTRSLPTIVALWVVTATIPAAAVWLLMRTPTRSEAPIPATSTIEDRPQVAPPVPVEASPKPAPAPAEPLVAANTAPAAEPPVSEPQSPPAASTLTSTSATRPVPSAPVVVETESSDRVSVLVKSRPDGARVYRRGKEIGRTPLTIQIGRGEHRIFEVGATSSTTRRVTLDGEKPEITVNLANMAIESKPQTTYLPAPMPSTKYDRLH